MERAVTDKAVALAAPGRRREFDLRNRVERVKETERFLIVSFRGGCSYAAFKKGCFRGADEERMEAFSEAAIKASKEFPRTEAKLSDCRGRGPPPRRRPVGRACVRVVFARFHERPSGNSS